MIIDGRLLIIQNTIHFCYFYYKNLHFRLKNKKLPNEPILGLPAAKAEKIARCYCGNKKLPQSRRWIARCLCGNEPIFLSYQVSILPNNFLCQIAPRSKNLGWKKFFFFS
jgi:hypothetical protein